MPYPNEHACRVNPPGEFTRLRRNNDADPNVIIGFREDGSSDVQAFRYPKDRWTSARARTHCQRHKGTFEEASDDDDDSEENAATITTAKTTFAGETILMPSTPIIHADFTTKLEDVSGEDRTLIAVISSAAVDRDNEVILPQGAVLDNYRKNPVVLWSHDYRMPPIAKATWIRHDRGSQSLKAKLQFADTEFAQEIYRLYQGEYLRAFSIGFSSNNAEWREPTKAEVARNPDWGKVGRVYTKWELYEFSAVAVPANPEAMAVAVGKGVVTQETVNKLGLVVPSDDASPSSLAQTAAADTQLPSERPEPPPSLDTVQAEPEPEPAKADEPEPIEVVSRPALEPDPVVIVRLAPLLTRQNVLESLTRELDRRRGRV